MTATAKLRAWYRCDDCGRFIAYDDLRDGKALCRMETPDSEYTVETWTTLCAEHATAKRREDA
jgi:hypothetical protein